LDTIVHKAIEHDPDRRYPSAAELAADLRRWLADEPIVARPATLRYQLGRFTRRNRALVAAACVGVASLIAATATSTAFAVRAAEARAEAERAAQDAQTARAEAERDRDAAIDATRAALTAQEAERAQREQAETQRTLAEARFNDVRTLAGALVFDIEARLRDLPGATEARRALVSTGVRYLDLLAEDADDPALLDEVARSYMRIADVQGGQRTASLGDSDAALASLNKSADIRRALLERNPDSERDRLWLSAALKFTAETLTATGRSDEALAKLEEALELGNDQIARTPESFGARRDRGLTLGATADLLMTLGQADRAYEMFTEARAQAEILAEQAKGTPGAGRLLRDLAIAQGDEGRALVALGRTDEALARYTESAATRERLLEANPTSARARRDMISLAARLGDLEQGRGNYAQALGWHRRALALAESAVRDDASNTTALYNLSVSLENVCDALLELARINEAAAAAERCVDLRRRLIEVDPSNTHWAVALAVAVERAGRVAERAPDADAANAHYAEAYDLAERVSAADPAAALPWRVLLFTSSRLGELETAAAEAARSPGAVLERAEAARQWLTRAGAALDGMNARSITPYTTQATREELAAVETRVDQIAPPNAERVQ
ncbi:MAG: tetratricopeptide repeat protein, partial [Planctomycetota bacterium]